MGKKRKNTELQKDNVLSRRDFFKKGAAAGVGAVALAGLGKAAAQSASSSVRWDYEFDVVIVGAGATGLPAAIRAHDLGASVLVIDQNYEVGGKALHSGGRVSLGGGDALQLRDAAGESDPDGFISVGPLFPPEAFDDNPELLFKDMTDWSVLDSAGVPRYRFNERELHRAWADSTVAVRDFLMANYVRFQRIDSTHTGGGVSRARAARAMWKIADTTDMRAGTVTQEEAGLPDERSSALSPTIMVDAARQAGPGIVNRGCALTRPLEFRARELGIRFMLSRHMDELVREQPYAGRVLGIRASYSPRHLPDTGERLESYWDNGNIDERRETVYIRARKAVIVASGGHTGNPQFRSMFYPAMREPAFVASGWAHLGPRGGDASGIIAGMRIGANLAGMQQNYLHPSGLHVTSRLATRDAYTDMYPGYPGFPFRGSTGFSVGGSGFEQMIAVNQVGKRFFNESYLTSTQDHSTFPGGPSRGTQPWQSHVPTDWRNTRPEWVSEIYSYHSGLDAALAINEGSAAPDFLSGPIWAIFDQAAVERGGWDIGFPYTADNGYFFAADTIPELARLIEQNEFQRVPLQHLVETVENWNAIVDAGVDEEFERSEGMHKIETPRFYAAYIGLVWHDSYGGLRINGKAQVVDTQGQVIPGLYAGGEASGGGEQHGLGRATVHGYLAGTNAAAEPRS